MAAKKSRKTTRKSPAKKAAKAPARKRHGAKAVATRATTRATKPSAADDARMASFSEEVGRMAEKRFGSECRVVREIVDGSLKIRVICPPGRQC